VTNTFVRRFRLFRLAGFDVRILGIVIDVLSCINSDSFGVIEMIFDNDLVIAQYFLNLLDFDSSLFNLEQDIWWCVKAETLLLVE
jgi:hypothetical protein